MTAQLIDAAKMALEDLAHATSFASKKARDRQDRTLKALRLAIDTCPKGSVPDGVWEALQRLIENGEVMGPASREDAQLVAAYRDRVRFMAPFLTPNPSPTKSELVKALVSQKKRLETALELACSHLTDEQAEAVRDAMPEEAQN